jgi:tetratricopeptide (TPR) repeat protein
VSPRRFLSALLLLTGAAALKGQADVEAKKAALAAVREPRPAFLKVLDADGLLERRFGTEVWRDLSEKQRKALLSAVGDRFLGMLAPPPGVAGEIAWSESLAPRSGEVDVLVGLRLAEKTLKTSWRMRRDRSSQWRATDVILSDPGISLADATLSTLGPQPVRRQDRMRRARDEVLPSLAALAAVGLAVVLALPRVAPSRRRILYLTATLPALLFAGAASVAAARVVAEPYAVRIAPAAEPWRRFEDLALAAQREGRSEQARELWARAIAAGGPPGPAAYEMGLAARESGDVEAARAFFEGALAVPSPAPGAARELALLALEAGRPSEAERWIIAYLAGAGPDPDALSLEAVAKTNLGKTSEAVGAIEAARRLVGGGSKAAELEAQIRARASDAAGAVAALRPLTRDGHLSRDALRRDPAYLPIATDPVWVSFLSESKGGKSEIRSTKSETYSESEIQNPKLP